MAASTIMPCALSSLELMLRDIQREEEGQHGDVPPALPARPMTRARLPRSRARLRFASRNINGGEDNEDQVGSMESIKSENGVERKINCLQPGKFSDVNEASVQEILGIQNHEDQLNQGVIALQSFIRGANARKYFAKKMTAIVVIQKRLKSQFLRSRLLEEEDRAVIYLQESIRGWLAWRHLNSMDQKLSDGAKNMKNFELKDQQVQVPYSVLVDLQRRVLKTEALLDEKKEENATLRLQMKQLERQKQQFETRMKSMEKTWQDQLTSLQASLAADKKGSSRRNSAGKLGMLFSLPENSDEDAQDSLTSTNNTSRLSSDQIELDYHHQNRVSGENVGVMEEVHNDPEVEAELRKLKLKFKTWKREFRTRLVVAKTKVKKLGDSEDGERISCHRKWWGRK